MVLVEKQRVFQRGGNYVLLVSKNMPERVAILNCSGGQRNVFFRGVERFFFVNQNTHVFATGVGNVEVFCRKRNLLFRGAASLFC